MLDILSGLRKKYCMDCPSSQVCNGVCICMSYMYVQQDDLLQYSCNQSNSIFSRILSINDEIMRDFKEGNTEKYNNIIKRKFTEK